LVWDPIAPFVRSANRVFIAPEGLLHVVPLAALPDGNGRTIAESGPLIHLLATERDLVTTTGPGSEGRGLLAMGGPAFDTPGTTPQAQLTSADPCAILAGGRFDPLPGATQEVEEIAREWDVAGESAGTTNDDRAHVLTGAGATERALRESAPGRRALHVAAHGYFLPSQCSIVPPEREVDPLAHPLLRAGLALAGANQRDHAPSAENDGILSAEEVAGLDLASLEWVVLSACETGLGELDLNEGVLGLRRAFRAAGAQALVMSLWRVDDEATREWMRALYHARFADRLEPVAAARAATHEVLRARRAEGRSTHPYYWASFIVESGRSES
jgi:CHAT domain-containing protein